MINILVNAYAISPNWGSEQGMGWNWIINLAKYCHLDVITEGEWREEIEYVLKNLPQRDNLTFHYLPTSDKVRKMCWNQGDWRFYGHYRKWQKKALACAKNIIADHRIDVIHQLNMVGFREPGYLWQIKDIPFVWGPVGGMELMPMTYLKGAPAEQRYFNCLKNILNRLQYNYSPRVKAAIKRADVIISAVKGVQDVIKTVHHKDSILINETGVEIISDLVKKESNANEPLRIIWVGKFDFRKQLPIAIRSIIAMNNKNIEFHICGTGSEAVTREMHEMAAAGGIGVQCFWHGNVPNKYVKRLMAESDLMLFTSIMEATSTVVLEAVSVGLPIVCFNTCGFGPIVKRFAGITIELSNPDQSVIEFASILDQLYTDRFILNRISEKILLHRQSLTWESKAKQTVEIYKEILK